MHEIFGKIHALDHLLDHFKTNNMAQQTAMQTLIAWGDEMLLKHPQKILSFGEAIDKAVELLQMEKEHIVEAFYEGMKTNPFDPNRGRGTMYYNETYKKQ
jgi:hypothetical protein